MSNVYKKMMMVLSVVLLTASAYTNEKNTQDKTACEKSCTVCEKNTFPDMCGYNCPANLDIKCGWDFFISGSFLYWQAREHGIDVGTYNVNTNDITMANLKSPDFKFHPAFKVAIGGTSSYDKWNFRGQYTRFSATNHGSLSAPVSALLGDVEIDSYFTVLYNPNPFFADSLINEIKNSWKLDLNIADVDMGRTYFVGQQLIFNPFIGIKGGKIDQTLNFVTTFVNRAATTETGFDENEVKVKTWLVGPRVGLDTTWRIGCGFNIFGDFAAALVYQDMKIDQDYTQPVQPVNTTLFKTNSANKTAQVVPNVEYVLGLAWGSYFNDNSWHVDIAAGYEFQRYFSQLGFIIPIVGKSIPNGDLSLHGLTLTAKIDF